LFGSELNARAVDRCGVAHTTKCHRSGETSLVEHLSGAEIEELLDQQDIPLDDIE
jgi:hypothetical protein